MNTNAHKISVSFEKCESGWIIFTISSEAQSVRLRASEVYDPFPGLVSWLEAIVVGVEQCAFDIDEEGPERRFQFARVSWDRHVLTICSLYSPSEVFLSTDVDPRQLVEEFYHKLKIYSRSDKYVKKEWESETLGERFARLMSVEKSSDSIMATLLTYNRGELMNILFKAAPSYTIDCPGATTDNERFAHSLDSMLHPDDPEKQKGIVHTPNEWNIPVEYDHMTLKQKEIIVQECLEERVSSYGGTKLQDIRSKIVEDWIENRT